MPPKNKDTSKKPAEARPPILINGLSKEEIFKEQVRAKIFQELEEHIVRLREELDREIKESNYFQLQKNNIHTFQTVSERKLEEDEAKLKNLEKAVEEDECRHRLEIKLLKQKMKHLLCEHQNTISELKAGGSVSMNALQKGQDELEAEFYKDMDAVMAAIQEHGVENRVRQLELKHKEEMAATRDNLERLLADTKGKNEEKMQVEQQKLENLNRIVMSEKELHWNKHIAALTEDHNNTVCEIKATSINTSEDFKERDTYNEIRKLRRTLGKMKQEKHSVMRDNCHVTELISKVEKKITYSQNKAELSSENKMKIPKRKAVEKMKADHEEMEQKFSKLQLERDELSESFPQKIQSVRDEAEMPNSLLESQLQSLKDHLKKFQAQLHSVLSAPNMDRTALTEVTDKAEEYLQFKDSTIKNLEHKRNLMSKARKDLLLTAETRALFS